MDVNEVRKHKAALENKVSEAMREFEANTGCKVKSLFYVRSKVSEKYGGNIIESQIEI